MSRPLSADMLAAIVSGNVRFANMASFAFDDATAYYTTTPFNVTWGGNTFIGLGNLASIDPLEETSDLQAQTFVITLNGVPSANVAEATTENVQGRIMTLYTATFDSQWRLLGTPDVNRRCQMDTMKIRINGPSAVIEVTCRNRWAIWGTPPISRFTQDDQKQRFPNDNFFEFGPQMQQKPLIWQ